MSDYYGESEKSYQTSIWMLHAILDGAGEDGRSDAIEDDDRDILNKCKTSSFVLLFFSSNYGYTNSKHYVLTFVFFATST